MKFYIPEIGDSIKLTNDWTFYLLNESRNHLDLSMFGTGKSFKDGEKKFDNVNNEVIIPAGSILKIDRIYIRKGMDEYSSITFYLTDVPGEKIKKQRFWAKLKDVNNIDFEKHIEQDLSRMLNFEKQYYLIGEKRNSYGSNHVDNLINFKNHVSMFYQRKVEPKCVYAKVGGEVHYTIKESFTTRPLNEEERTILYNEYFKNNKRSIINPYGYSKDVIEKCLNFASILKDYKLNILNKEGKIVKSYKSLASCKKWIKDDIK